MGEDGGHLFFKCKAAKQVWELLSMEGLRQNLAAQASARDTVAIILKEKEPIRTHAVVTLWFLWTNRNAIRHEERGRSGSELARGIKSYCHELLVNQGAPNVQRSQANVKWCRPPEGVLKLNCDASFRADENTGSWGFIIRDHDGDVVLTGRGRLNHVLSAFQVELIACMQGVQAALNLGIGRLLLETDALMIVQAMNSDVFDAMAEGVTLEELKFLVRVNFSEFKCNFLSRVGNRAAHALAALGSECVEGEALITSSVPRDVHVIVADDLSDK